MLSLTQFISKLKYRYVATMPIDIDMFDQINAEQADVTPQEAIIRLLVDNNDQAFLAREIAAATDVATETVTSVLAELEEQQLVRHRGDYWAITNDRERIHRAVDLSRAIERLDERYGPEEKANWMTN